MSPQVSWLSSLSQLSESKRTIDHSGKNSDVTRRVEGDVWREAEKKRWAFTWEGKEHYIYLLWWMEVKQLVRQRNGYVFKIGEIKSNSEAGSPWFFICLRNGLLISKMEQVLKGCYRYRCHRFCHRGIWAREPARRDLSGIKSKIYSLSRIGISSQLWFLFSHSKTHTRAYSV